MTYWYRLGSARAACLLMNIYYLQPKNVNSTWNFMHQSSQILFCHSDSALKESIWPCYTAGKTLYALQVVRSSQKENAVSTSSSLITWRVCRLRSEIKINIFPSMSHDFRYFCYFSIRVLGWLQKKITCFIYVHRCLYIRKESFKTESTLGVFPAGTSSHRAKLPLSIPRLVTLIF